MSIEIEKQNLEVHVELCSERYSNLQDKIENIEARMTKFEEMLGELKDLIIAIRDKRNDQLIVWGASIIAALVSALAFLVYEIIKKH